MGEPVREGLWPKTLTHGDFHGSNILLKEDGNGQLKTPLEAVVLDFQVSTTTRTSHSESQ